MHWWTWIVVTWHGEVINGFTPSWDPGVTWVNLGLAADVDGKARHPRADTVDPALNAAAQCSGRERGEDLRASTYRLTQACQFVNAYCLSAWQV